MTEGMDFTALKQAAAKKTFDYPVVFEITEEFRGDFNSGFVIKTQTKINLVETESPRSIVASVMQQEGVFKVDFSGISNPAEEGKALFPAAFSQPLNLLEGESTLELGNGNVTDSYHIMITDNRIMIENGGETAPTFSSPKENEILRINPLLENYPGILDDADLQVRAIQDDPANICYMKSASEAVQREAIKNNGASFVLKCVESPSESVLEDALRADPGLIESIQEPSSALQVAAIQACRRDDECDVDFIFNWIDNPSDDAIEAAYGEMSTVEEALNEDGEVVMGEDEDTDRDGIINSEDTDDDGDGLPDSEERYLETDPFKKDTDGDGIDDMQEYMSGIDPLVANTGPTLLYPSPAGGVKGTKITLYGVNFGKDYKGAKVWIGGDIVLRDNDVKLVNDREIEFYIPGDMETSEVRVDVDGKISNPQTVTVTEYPVRSIAEFPQITSFGKGEVVKDELYVAAEKSTSFKKMQKFLLTDDVLKRYDGRIISRDKELNHYVIRFTFGTNGERTEIIEALEASDLVSDAMPYAVFKD